MKILMLMPSCRWWFWPLIKANYECAFCLGVQVRLAVVLWPEEVKSIPTFALDVIRSAPWIEIVEVQRQEGIPAGIQKFNSALEKLLPDYDGYVQSINDDNLVPKRFFEEFLRGTETGKKVIVFSHSRGQRDIASINGTSDLIAAPENVKPCSISGEQYIVHASLWAGKKFGVSDTADGEFITALFQTNREDFYFRPEFFTPFNAIEVGRTYARFDNDKLKALLES